MTRRRSADFSLREAVADPGFTPRAADSDALADLAVSTEEQIAKQAALALTRVEGGSPRFFDRILRGGEAEPIKRAFRAMGHFELSSHGPAMAELALASLQHVSAGVRRGAARILGKVGDPALVTHLLRSREREADRSVYDELTLAIARSGHTDIEAPSVAHGVTQKKAHLIALREHARRTPTQIDLTRQLPTQTALDPGTRLLLRVRQGLEPILQSELSACGQHFSHVRPGELEAPVGELGPAIASRIALDFGFSIPCRETSEPPGIAQSLVDVSPLLRHYTSGPIRYRLRVSGRGKSRSLVREVALLAQNGAEDLVNDPNQSAWEVVVEQKRMLLIPKPSDTRFGYRIAEVPAASHPTIAAALARLAMQGKRDVVWDPFVGSGLELCERHLLGDCSLLVGTDIDERAVAAASSNLQQVGATKYRVHLLDARKFDPPPLTAVISNVPLGRRVVRDRSLGALLVEVLHKACAALQPGGRIAITCPHPDLIHPVFGAAGLSCRYSSELDMGGFSATLLCFERPGRRRAPRTP